MFKNIIKKGVKIFTSMIMVVAITGCRSSDGDTQGGQLVKVSISVSGNTPAATAIREVFEPMIEEKTKGKYDIQIYDSGVLGAEKVTYDYTKSSIIEMSVVSTSMWSETEVMTIPDFPFVFRDVEHARRAYQGELGEYITEEIEKEQPVKLLSWMPNGARVFSSTKEISNVDDFEGQKLRMPNNPIHVKMAESLGANVVIMDMGEVFTALEQGVVDGQDNPLSTVRNEGWYEVQDYVYETNHIVSSLELFVGQEFWNTLNEEEKDIFQEAALKASDYAWDLYIDQLDEDRKFMEEQGIQVISLNEEDKEALKTKIEPVYEYLDSQYPWAAKIRKMIEEIE